MYNIAKFMTIIIIHFVYNVFKDESYLRIMIAVKSQMIIVNTIKNQTLVNVFNVKLIMVY